MLDVKKEADYSMLYGHLNRTNAQQHLGLMMTRRNNCSLRGFALTLSACLYLSISLSLSSCDATPEYDRRISVETEKRDTVEVELAELVERHKAAASWSDIIPIRSGGYRTTIYSVDLEEALETYPDTAILFIVELNDISRTDSGYKAYFSSHRMVWGGFPGTFDLHCRENLKDYLVSFMSHNVASGFAIIAKVSSFSRPRFKVDVSIDEEFPEESEVSIEASKQFVLRGELVEALYIRNIGPLMRYELSRRESPRELQADN